MIPALDIYRSAKLLIDQRGTDAPTPNDSMSRANPNSRFQTEAHLMARDFRNGSTTDLRRHHQEGLLLGVKRTQSVRKRTPPLEGRLLGAERTYSMVVMPMKRMASNAPWAENRETSLTMCGIQC